MTTKNISKPETLDHFNVRLTDEIFGNVGGNVGLYEMPEWLYGKGTASKSVSKKRVIEPDEDPEEGLEE